ncbi:MAG: ACT domain-containing protein [Sphingomonadales bacterium]|nr:ACT domain-containing protein [Sphingomonadales bacterium]
MAGPVGDLRAMLTGLAPVLDEARYAFCTSTDAATIAAALPEALGSFREAEGMTLILPVVRAAALGFDTALPMARIVLTVNSALDGVGLTAAVATALAQRGIACNMVAAFHHDHVFVPADRADEALAVLQGLQAAPAIPPQPASP